jgi:Protein of unknown function (DUF1236)
MKSHLRYSVAALALLSGVGVASAAGAGTSLKASDNLNLTTAQEHLLWQSIGKQKANMKAPSDFTASVGVPVPRSVTLRGMPSDVTNQIPAVGPYRYAVLANKLLIVNPTDKTVVDIITQ